MTTDRELLRRYVQEGAEEAFAEIVRRHVDLVYGAAQRQLCGNAALAGDVTQAVFTALAAKGEALLIINHLSAWLYTTTRFTVSHTVRTERRRQVREQKAQSMHALLVEPEAHDLPRVSDELFDEVLAELEDGDREAILLRFFEGQPFATIGAAMQVSEDAARMRVARALEKIRTLFARNGITSSTAAVGALLANQVIAAPVHLAASVSTTALTAGTAVIAAATTGAKLGVLTFMTTTKATVSLAGAAVIFALGYSGYQHRQATVRTEELARSTQNQDRLRDDLRRSEERLAKLAQLAAQAEQRAAELQQRVDGFSAARAKPMAAASAPDARALTAQRMAKMKPLLEAGMPIKGALIVTRGNVAVSQPVEFVMGKETRIEADEGTYAVKPALHHDGSVKYAISLSKKVADGDEEQREQLPTIVQIPWEGFTVAVSGAGGKVMAFDPDKTEP